MQFLANENVPVVSIRRLRAAGYDVASVIEDSPGATDEAILWQAHTERRIILTFDRDYGELIYRRRLPNPAGVPVGLWRDGECRMTLDDVVRQGDFPIRDGQPQGRG